MMFRPQILSQPANTPVDFSFTGVGNTQGTSGLVVKGTSIPVIAGTNDIAVTQPGKFTKLVGIQLYSVDANPVAGEICSLKINSRSVLDQVPGKAIAPAHNPNTSYPFFPLFISGLAGNDDIQFTITGTATKQFVLICFYLP
jgi:hypothetical protein